MVDVQNRVTDLREEAYAKVLKCLPYPREWATELLITGLRNEFGIVDDVHEEILEAVMTNTERPRKRQKHGHSAPYEPSSPQQRKAVPPQSPFAGQLPDPAGSEALAWGSARDGIADKVEQAKQKVKAQGSANLGPSSRLAANVAGPIKAKKRKERLETSNAFAALSYEPPQTAHQQQMRQLTEDEIAQGCKLDPFLGMRVSRLWPEDGGWFEGVVTDYSAADRTHCITYNFNTDDESFEWYDLRNRNSKECSILKGKIDLLAKTAKQQPPAQPNGLPAAGSKSQRKPGQGFGRGTKKAPGRHSGTGGRGSHSQRVAPHQSSAVHQQAPTAHKFQVVSSDDDDYGGGGSDEDVSDDGDYGL